MNLVKTNKTIFSIMFLSVFFSYYIRINLMGKAIASVNIIFILALIVYSFLNRKNNNLLVIAIITFIIIYVFIVDFLGNNNAIMDIIKNICILFIPLYLLTIQPNYEDKKEVVKACIKIFNFFTIIIFLIGIIDPLINLSITNFLANNITPDIIDWINFNATTGVYRYTSYMGHPLFTKEIFIYFFLFNTLYGKVYNEYLINWKIIMSISLIGILLSGSKAGILLIIVSILFLKENGERNFKYYIGILAAFGILYTLGLFDTVILRFQTTTLTTGREEWWQYIQDYKFLRINLFSGYGENIYSIISQKVGDVYTTAGLEYPLRVFIYKYGVLCTLLIMIILVFPVIIFVNRRQYFIVFACLIKFAEVFTYNGLVFKADNMILFILFVYIMILMSIDDMERNCKLC